MNSRIQVALVALCSIALVTPACGDQRAAPANDTVRSEESAERAQAVGILHAFLLRGKSTVQLANEIGSEQFRKSLTITPLPFSVHNGHIVHLESEKLEAIVSLHYGMVVLLKIPGAAPTEVSSSQKGETAPGDIGGGRVSYDEALLTAQRFMVEHEGEHVLDRMSLISGDERVHKSDRPGISFSWWSAENDQICWGSEHIIVALNAITGKVFYFFRDGGPVLGEPNISPDQARKLAVRFFEAAGIEAQIQLLTYGETPMQEGDFVPTWAIRYREIILGPIDSISNLIIDANTGEVIPDPSWLNRPEMTFSLQEKRSFIKEITQKMRGDTDQSSAAAN